MIIRLGVFDHLFAALQYVLTRGALYPFLCHRFVRFELGMYVTLVIDVIAKRLYWIEL